MLAVLTGNKYCVTKMDPYNKNQTKQYTHAHAHTFTLHTQHMLASKLGWVTTKENHLCAYE